MANKIHSSTAEYPIGQPPNPQPVSHPITNLVISTITPESSSTSSSSQTIEVKVCEASKSTDPGMNHTASQVQQVSTAVLLAKPEIDDENSLDDLLDDLGSMCDNGVKGVDSFMLTQLRKETNIQNTQIIEAQQEVTSMTKLQELLRNNPQNVFGLKNLENGMAEIGASVVTVPEVDRGKLDSYAIKKDNNEYDIYSTSRQAITKVIDASGNEVKATVTIVSVEEMAMLRAAINEGVQKYLEQKKKETEKKDDIGESMGEARTIEYPTDQLLVELSKRDDKDNPLVGLARSILEKILRNMMEEERERRARAATAREETRLEEKAELKKMIQKQEILKDDIKRDQLKAEILTRDIRSTQIKLEELNRIDPDSKMFNRVLNHLLSDKRLIPELREAILEVQVKTRK